MERYSISDLGRMENLPNRTTISGWVSEYEHTYGDNSFRNRGHKAPGGAVTYDLADINELLRFKGYEPLPSKVFETEVEVIDSNHTTSVDLVVPEKGQIDLTRFKSRPRNNAHRAQVDALVASVRKAVAVTKAAMEQDNEYLVEEYEHNKSAIQEIEELALDLNNAHLKYDIENRIIGRLNDSAIDTLADKKNRLSSQLVEHHENLGGIDGKGFQGDVAEKK